MSKKYVSLVVLFVLITGFSFSMSVIADDDHDHDDYRSYKKYDDRHDDYEREYEEYDGDEHDDDDDHDEDDEFYEKQQETIVSKEFWYKWSRSAVEPMEVETLPIAEQSKLSLLADNQTPLQVEVIPTGGQLLVPIVETAKLMGAEVTVYPNSEIIEINKDNKQLIVRQNAKVVYENMRKTPMQTEVVKRDGNYYLSIAVLANGLGYEINETVNNNQIRLERIEEL